MADRTSAALFQMMFTFLAENPDNRAKEIAAKLYDKIFHYDFEMSQMNSDKALVALDLAKKCNQCNDYIYKDREQRHKDWCK